MLHDHQKGFSSAKYDCKLITMFEVNFNNFNAAQIAGYPKGFFYWKTIHFCKNIIDRVQILSFFMELQFQA